MGKGRLQQYSAFQRCALRHSQQQQESQLLIVRALDLTLHIELLDVLGKRVYESYFSQNQSAMRISTQSLKAGIYFLRTSSMDVPYYSETRRVLVY